MVPFDRELKSPILRGLGLFPHLVEQPGVERAAEQSGPAELRGAAE